MSEKFSRKLISFEISGTACIQKSRKNVFSCGNSIFDHRETQTASVNRICQAIHNSTQGKY